jgi:GR25 family glycosyltransferase involved in LPS biosynthesis
MDYFDRVYCIHYPDPTRREAIEEQFKRVGITGVEYVYAERPKGKFHITNMRRAPAAEFAVNLSHIKAVTRALADNAKRPVFFEDDIVFRNDANEILAQSLKALPDDWDVLYMGGHPCDEVDRLSDNLVKVARFSFAESYAISGRSLVSFLDFWFDRIGQLQAMYDRILGEFAELNDGYCVYPVITHQPLGYSHIVKANDDKRSLVQRGWQNNLT